MPKIEEGTGTQEIIAEESSIPELEAEQEPEDRDQEDNGSGTDNDNDNGNEDDNGNEGEEPEGFESEISEAPLPLHGSE